ncbi:IgGFc-binding protein [Nannocystis bainbridge]|uniref:IgGFc-binding protein n=1 Tax=Nannocystis bainbridge TaxID=2995303 RepID=A0ABT5DXY3_9BACT|nr:IgGFc-binding protein [Nannocystis bainbridge]MDC0717603.1 IgGFc-binding protein [Nannocystis bainbridge]
MRLRWLACPTLALALAGCPGPYTPATTENETSSSSASSSSPTETTTQSTTTTSTAGPTSEPTTTPSGCVGTDERCDGEQHQICVGGNWIGDPCPAGTGCQDGAKTCETCDCAAPPTCLDASTLETCGCLVPQQTTCPEGQACDAEAGACSAVLCTPGEQTCTDQNTRRTCNEYGTGYEAPVTCDGDELCDPDMGACMAACSVVAKRQSSIGCEFWAVDMANVPPRDAYVYAVAVSNPSATEPVNVEIFDGNKNGAEQKLLTGVIAPRQVRTFLLSGSSNNQNGFYPGDAGFTGSGIAPGRAFRVVSDLPIVATQFNPLGGALAFTTDASLLLPTHALGSRYFHLAWGEGLGSGSSLVVVATADDTTISLKPTVNVAAGQNGMPALTKGVTTEIKLDRYDYVQLQTNSGDTTGSEIVADKPVAVFGGHSCGQVPNKTVTFCDHLEEQIFPVDTWGIEYVALRSPARGTEDMFWRVLARESGATVTFTPKPEGLAEATQVIPAGGFIQFNASGDFRIQSNNPIMVAGYMYGSEAPGVPANGNPGDPSMVLMVPTEQWLGDYVFLVDSSYANDNVRLVRKAMNNNVELGCLGGLVPDDHWKQIPGTQYVTAVVNINPGEGDCQAGTNTASAKTTTFGVIVTGEAQGASYAYPGGMALREIAPG